MNGNPLVFLMGPTAIGKTATAIALAKSINGEIINVDSGQVYRTLDIGTAKPSTEERSAVPHHLVDIVDPQHAYSAARFCDDAVAAIKRIRETQRTPILAGGTMLYFNALEKGLAPLPEANADVRAQIESEAKDHGWISLHEQLESVDSVAAARIHPNDPQRISRALEVFRLTGTSLTDLHAKTESLLLEFKQPLIKFALLPASREWLHNRIENRFMAMLDEGFLDEVRQLMTQNSLHAELPSMRSVGYRQAWAHINGASSYDDFVAQGLAATRQLAKRQMTWVRGMDNVHTILCDDEHTTEHYVNKMLAVVNESRALDNES